MIIQEYAEKLKVGQKISLGDFGHLSAIRFVTEDSIRSLGSNKARVTCFKYKLVYHPSKELKDALK
tara:strand:- start:373 stop:570 length:198 start_codon:yes stop_codon:yes gene_type:complete